MITNAFANVFVGEMVGMFLLMAIGIAAGAAVSLKRSGLKKAGPIFVALGWGMGIMVGALVASAISGTGHINPAMTIMNMVMGNIDAGMGFTAIAGQVVGALMGVGVVVMIYWNQFSNTEESSAVDGVFLTGDKEGNKFSMFGAEYIAALILGLVVLNLPTQAGIGPLIAGLTFVGIVIMVGGVSGAAVNPTRDLVPRLIHWLNRIPNQGADSNWKYALIPTIAPIAGALSAAGIMMLVA